VKLPIVMLCNCVVEVQRCCGVIGLIFKSSNSPIFKLLSIVWLRPSASN